MVLLNWAVQQIYELIFEYSSTTLPNLIKQPNIKYEEIVDQGGTSTLWDIRLQYYILSHHVVRFCLQSTCPKHIRGLMRSWKGWTNQCCKDQIKVIDDFIERLLNNYELHYPVKNDQQVNKIIEI